MLSHQEAFKRLDTLALCALALGIAVSPAAQDAPPAPPGLNAHRIANPIRLDGVLDDEGWREAERVETWFETNPGAPTGSSSSRSRMRCSADEGP